MYIPPQDETFELPSHGSHPGSTGGGAELQTGTAGTSVTISGVGTGGFEAGQGIVDISEDDFWNIVDSWRSEHLWKKKNNDFSPLPRS